MYVCISIILYFLFGFLFFLQFSHYNYALPTLLTQRTQKENKKKQIFLYQLSRLTLRITIRVQVFVSSYKWNRRGVRMYIGERLHSVLNNSCNDDDICSL